MYVRACVCSRVCVCVSVCKHFTTLSDHLFSIGSPPSGSAGRIVLIHILKFFSPLMLGKFISKNQFYLDFWTFNTRKRTSCASHSPVIPVSLSALLFCCSLSGLSRFCSVWTENNLYHFPPAVRSTDYKHGFFSMAR